MHYDAEIERLRKIRQLQKERIVKDEDLIERLQAALNHVLLHLGDPGDCCYDLLEQAGAICAK